MEVPFATQMPTMEQSQHFLSEDDYVKILDDLTCIKPMSMEFFPDFSDASSFEDSDHGDVALVPQLDLLPMQPSEEPAFFPSMEEKPAAIASRMASMECPQGFPSMLFQPSYVPPSPPPVQLTWQATQQHMQSHNGQTLSSPVSPVPQMSVVPNLDDRQPRSSVSSRHSRPSFGAGTAIVQTSRGILSDALHRRSPSPDVIVPPSQCRGDGEGGWDTELLDMSTVSLNRYLKTSDLTPAEVVALKTTRRRIKNRGYTQRSRARKAQEKDKCGKSSR